MPKEFKTRIIANLMRAKKLAATDIHSFFFVIHKLMPYLSSAGETSMFMNWNSEAISAAKLPGMEDITAHLNGYNEVNKHIPSTEALGTIFILIKLYKLKRTTSLLDYYYDMQLHSPENATIKSEIIPYYRDIEYRIRKIYEKNSTLNLPQRTRAISQITNMTSFNEHYTNVIELIKYDIGAAHPIVRRLENYYCSQFLVGGSESDAFAAEIASALTEPYSRDGTPNFRLSRATPDAPDRSPATSPDSLSLERFMATPKAIETTKGRVEPYSAAGQPKISHEPTQSQAEGSSTRAINEQQLPEEHVSDRHDVRKIDDTKLAASTRSDKVSHGHLSWLNKAALLNQERLDKHDKKYTDTTPKPLPVLKGGLLPTAAQCTDNAADAPNPLDESNTTRPRPTKRQRVRGVTLPPGASTGTQTCLFLKTGDVTDMAVAHGSPRAEAAVS